MKPVRSSPLSFGLIASGTALGIAGTDLVLPAVPILPDHLGGSIEQAQLVLAAFTAGAAAGLLLFGELGARYDQRLLLVLSLLTYGLTSLACTLSSSLTMLIGLRLLQGASGSAAAVFAPGMLRALYGDKGAVGALGALGSVEALAPALAPLAGVWLLSMWGWRASFEVIAAGSLLLALTMVWRRDLFPPPGVSARHGSYLALLNNRSFVGHALGYALTLGGLLVFVFGAPSVFSRSMGLGMSAFIALQMCGILLFAAAANSTGQLVARLGSARVIWCGSLLSAAATLSMLGYALVGGRSLPVIIAIFAVMNVGLGLRGAPGFHAAITAGKGDDARASALVVLSILLTAAVGTSLVAPFISVGLVAIASGAAFLTAVGLAALVAVPRAARST